MSSTTVVNMMSIEKIIHHEPQYDRPAWSTPFWPRLRDSLIEDPELFNHLHLECGICLTDIARILPCGHMFGNKCLHAMIDEAFKDMNEGEVPFIACPSCRVVFSPHKDCSHPHSGKSMPTTMEGVYAMPATLSEGGVLSHSCGGCLAVEMISVVAVLAPVFTPPLDLAERETLIVYGTTANLHYWAVNLNLEDSETRYDEVVREIPLGDALQRVCDEINERLVQNSRKRWCSEDFEGLKFKIMLQRDVRPKATEYWETVEFLEEGFDLEMNLD
ncbi:hypothetical protein FGADI_12818 [Fusarium gaditjirri]|uniref:RING-type domain-containing protein n=1 Tax=Fusarium gaditjirri TaxID=282569 RepID=A0A8H4SRD9_9HYPO|nr:hypothetical protein FGADI_12818 [Fusarium gaditjirri]